jgi:hypothetical protein
MTRNAQTPHVICLVFNCGLALTPDSHGTDSSHDYAGRCPAGAPATFQPSLSSLSKTAPANLSQRYCNHIS